MPIIEDVAAKKNDEGAFYTLNYQELAVLNGAFVRLRFKTNADTYAHLTIAPNVEGKCRFKTYLGTVYTDPGTPPDGVKLTVFNRNTGSSRPSGTDLGYNPTIDTIGQLRGNRTIFAGTGPQSVGLLSGDGNKSVISPGTEFLIEIQNVSGQTQDIEIIAEGYEVVVDAI